jgi:hypothetical protein
MQPLVICDRLIYRRQFVLGPRPVNFLPSHNVAEIGKYFYLTTHFDLNTIHIVEGNRSLSLLGFILDPHHPDADDSAILKQLLPELCSDAHPKEFLHRLNVYGGRWILIANNGSRITLFNDALGQRQLYYTSPPVNGEVWCGAQPGIIASILNLEPSRVAMEFVEAQKKSGQQEYWFPNDTSAYNDIRLLLPNHYLNLVTAQPQRFWPSACLPKLSLRHAVKEGAEQLRGLMLSAGNRFPLAVLMTAGWDSRVVLAAAKNLKTQVSYFTCNLGNARTADADWSVPARLLPKLGKNHRVLDVAERMDPEFKEIYLQNVPMAHECMGPTAQALFSFLPSSEVRVSGSGSETVRQQFRPSRWDAVTAETLASFAWTKEKFAIEAFGKWLEGVPKDTGFHILDLFYWEQKCGQWLAGGQVEWDLVGESFAPFNCRGLLSTLLSTDVAYRVGPHYELYRALLRELWPEVLTEPINPHKKPRTDPPSVKAKVRDILVKLHLIEFVR